MSSVKFFLDNRGKNPVGDFLDKNKNIKIKAVIIIDNIREFGLSDEITLLHAFRKKSMKTPPREIKTAMKRYQ